MIASTYELYNNPAEAGKLAETAREELKLLVRFMPLEDLPPPRPKPFFDLLDRTLSAEIQKRVARPYWIDTLGSSRYVEIRVRLKDAVMRVLAPRAQTYASNTHIFLVWMVVSSVVLLTVAILFLRNQIRPILSLADAADRFGRGRPLPKDFKIRGAREVRLASHAFLEMRERIERHVEQRTTMLAGVSHDLRTILTRFRLQLAMLSVPEVEDLKRDVDEMQLMLEDYVAFAKGDAGEKTRRVDLERLIEEVRETFAAQSSATISIDIRQKPLIFPLRRNAMKRAIMNLTGNACRYGGRVSIRAVKTRRWLTVTVDDDGPGIAPEHREVVFKPFHSLDNARNQNVKSTGLGLAIARDIVRGHGGEIALSQSPLGGLQALIRIPVNGGSIAGAVQQGQGSG
jgi:two-component system osmolarity sensor histidine kinase EnvZ